MRLCKNISQSVHALRALYTGVLCCLCAVTAYGQEPSQPTLDAENLRAQLILHQAMPKSPHGDQQLATSPTAWISIERRQGTWQPVIATAWDYSQHEHRGWISEWQSNEDGFSATIDLAMRGDGWTAGGNARYQITAQVDENGELSGSYSGRIRSNLSLEIEGELSGSLWPSSAPILDAGERPRLLFRAADLPAIRERAATPFGQAALAQMEDSIAGIAFKHALSGEQELADEAQRRLRLLMDDSEHGQNNVLSRYYAWRLEQAALAFDLCYHAWDPEFRQELVEYMRRQMNVLMHGRGTLTNRIRWGHAGPHAPTLFYAAGIAALAIADEPGSAPDQPRPPILISDTAGIIQPVSDYSVPDDVPLHNFSNNTVPDDWLYVGAFPNDDFPATNLEARAALRPKPGDTLGDETWRSVEEEKLMYSGRHSSNQLRLLLTGPSGVKTHTNSYYYSVLNNDTPRWVRVHLGHGGVEMVLAGVPLREGDVIQLQEGLYPWLLTGPLGHMNPWAKSFAEPKLVEVGDAEVDKLKDQATARHQSSLAEWQRRMALWEATGEADVERTMLARTATHIMDMIYTQMLGRGGFIAGGDQLVGLDGPNKYAFIHHNVTGRSPGAHNEAALSLIRTMFVHPYAEDRTQVNQEINGLSGFIPGDYPEGGRDMASENFATLFPLLPEAWQPVALWAWQYHTQGSLDDEQSIARLVTPPTRNYPFSRPYGHFHTHPLFALLNYPMDMEPKKPQDILPLTWQAPDFGFYGFRSSWSGGTDQFITQVFAATHEEGAGTLRIHGFGEVWSHSLTATPPGYRFAENVVQIPGQDIRVDARATVLDFQQQDNGSGSIQLDLTPVYQHMQRNERGRQTMAYEAYSNIPRANASTDSGMSGQRAVAVDYSGDSGAPALIVIADSINGTDATLWTWQLDGSRKGLKPHEIDRSVPGREVLTQENLEAATVGALMHSEEIEAHDERITIHDNGFSISQGGATLRATFIAPNNPQVRLVQRRTYHKTNIEIINIAESTGIVVDGNENFVVALTIQQDEAPAISINDANSFQVGGQAVTIKDGIITIGKQ